MVGCTSPEHAEKIRQSMINHRRKNPMSINQRLQISKTLKEKGIRPPLCWWNDDRRRKLLETRMGGFWYGNVVYHEDISNKYCELWTEDLKERIRAYWGYVSALSGDIETSVNPRSGLVKSIACHHVYYQRKACCGWDEDYHGYYADINTGTLHNPVIIRHYIDGDPNKFVTLTAKEHKAIDYNKMHWIKTFEKLIADQGGKCYFTKKEIEDLLKE